MIDDASQPTVLELHVPADAVSWVARFESACTLLERHSALPKAPIRIGYFAREDAEREVTDRPAFLESTLSDPYRQVIISNGKRLRYTRTGEPLDEGKVLVKANFTRPAQSGCDVSIHVPAVSWETRIELLARLADLLQAHTGHLTPTRAMRTLFDVSRRIQWPEGVPNRDELIESLRPLEESLAECGLELPAIHRASTGGTRQSDLQPEQLGWVNYWSREAAEYLEFPDEIKDADLMARSSRTDAGAWLVKITPAPLDLTRPDHAQALAQLYQRFPRAGIRY